MGRKSGFNSWIGIITFLILIWVGTDWMSHEMEQQFYPWGYASSGRPTLTGTWVGLLVTDRGQRLAMLVEMELAPLDYVKRGSANRRRWLDGRALMCARPGRVRHFQAWGEPEDNRTASRFFLAISQAGDAPPDGLPPGRLHGQWGGKDSITLSGSLYLERGKPAIHGSSHPDTIGKTPATLARGTEADFNALCKRLSMQVAG